MNYDSYSVEHFLEDPFFIEWVKHKTPESDTYWNAWVSSNPANLPAMKEAEVQLRILLSAQRIEAESGEAAQVWGRIQNELAKSSETTEKSESSISAKTRPLFKRWMAAAAILLAVASGSYFMWNQKPPKTKLAATNNNQQVKEIDSAPGGNKAILTLADGSKIVLDTTNNGTITKQGNVTIIKLDGQLAYQQSTNNGEMSTAVTYNTITTPKGGQYQLILADGSKVWLNAASSLRFPTVFTGNERRVEISGEAYFEVAPNEKMPFYVKMNMLSGNGGEVKVLGTHFNIQAYENEEAIKTTLLEGLVRVSNGALQKTLKPGQQAQFKKASNQLNVLKNVNVEAVLAWKNGRFQFNSVDIKDIMRQAERWYNVEVTYEGSINENFSGNISRNVNIAQLLKVLEATEKVTFSISGRQIIVKPK